MKILLTGGTGFIGSYLLEHQKDDFILLTLNLRKQKPEEVDYSEVKTVVHLAGMAHKMEAVDEQEYFKVNRDLTLALAEQAKKAGVPHFIFMSSVKVFGDNSPVDGFRESHTPIPEDAYGASKYAAEVKLKELESDEFIVSIVRPSLVYGPGVKGNLDRLLRLIDKGTVLPFNNIDNKRSMVSIQNLEALIYTLVKNPTTGIIHATDKNPISTTELIQWMAEGMNKKPKLSKMPGPFRWLIRKLKPQLYTRLFGSYLINNAAGYNRINFIPPFEPKAGIMAMAQSFMDNKSKLNA